MRRTIRTLGIAAAGFVTAIGVAGASDPYQVSPESKAYVGFSFGGEKAEPRDLHYGLRIDQDSRIAPNAPALMQFDFNRRGFADARVNGLSVLKQEYRLRQTEGAAPAEGGAAAAPAEEEGFFSGMWHGVTHFFSGLFGGGEEKPAEAAPAAAAPAEAAAGGWSVVDWGLLAVGVAGVGVAGAASIGKDETPDASSGSAGGAAPTGGTVPTTGGTVPTTGGLVPTGLPGYRNIVTSPEYKERMEWLDGGTGHMGDLNPQ